MRICPKHNIPEPSEIIDGDYYFLCGSVEYSSPPLSFVSESKLPDYFEPQTKISGLYDFANVKQAFGYCSDRSVRNLIASGIINAFCMTSGKNWFRKDEIDLLVQQKRDEPHCFTLTCVYGEIYTNGGLVSVNKAAELADVSQRTIENLVNYGKMSGFTSSKPIVVDRGSLTQYYSGRIQ